MTLLVEEPWTPKAIVFVATTITMGLHRLSYNPFFFIQAPAANNHESGVFPFNWISQDFGEQAVKREALRAMRSPG